ncbi:hypothetical protein AOQ84DRAFT_157747 [Glonium stellatum]|uniref:Uncharacterized protein n=1 Tax=Glonium stellatum TaxID=574774 RepID=A0A8E2F8F4_9PEZI|nr:hypothetical protein AOQ84DRAFT_157747 [Glonium stellatum]
MYNFNTLFSKSPTYGESRIRCFLCSVPQHPEKLRSVQETVHQSQTQPQHLQPCICIHGLVACSPALLQEPNSCNSLLPTTNAHLRESSSPPFAQALRAHPPNQRQPTPSIHCRPEASRTPPRPTRSPHLLRSTRNFVLGIQILRGQANGGLWHSGYFSLLRLTQHPLLLT